MVLPVVVASKMVACGGREKLRRSCTVAAADYVEAMGRRLCLRRSFWCSPMTVAAGRERAASMVSNERNL